MANISLVN